MALSVYSLIVDDSMNNGLSTLFALISVTTAGPVSVFFTVLGICSSVFEILDALSY